MVIMVTAKEEETTEDPEAAKAVKEVTVNEATVTAETTIPTNEVVGKITPGIIMVIKVVLTLSIGVMTKVKEDRTQTISLPPGLNSLGLNQLPCRQI